MYHWQMKDIRWDRAKNEKLQSERGVTFEAILAAMAQGEDNE